MMDDRTRRQVFAITCIAISCIVILLTAIGIGRRVWNHSQKFSGSYDLTYADPQTGPRVRVNASSLAKIRADAVIQSHAFGDPEDWGMFRGPNANGVSNHTKLPSDWSERTPQELWRRNSGEGWSGIAIVGNRVFTQEQREENECVVCLDFDTGDEIWVHQDAARMPPSQNGVGPRATPTVVDGRVFTMGATGILNCLDSASGEPLWSLSIAEKFGGVIPVEGSCSFPLVHDKTVIVFIPGSTEGGIVGLSTEDGELLWRAGKGVNSLSSPQIATFAGVTQVMMATDIGIESVDPKSGELLWQYDSDPNSVYRMLQPLPMTDDSVILLTGQGEGLERFLVERDEKGQWTTKLVWHSREFQSSFLNVSVFDGRLYGNDESKQTCLDLMAGIAAWKERSTGGQVIPLGNTAQQIVIGLKGNVWMQTRNGDGFKVSDSFKALDGDCFAHGAFVRGRLVLRNESEMVCYLIE